MIKKIIIKTQNKLQDKAERKKKKIIYVQMKHSLCQKYEQMLK